LDDSSTIRFRQCLTLGRVEEYSHTIRTFQPVMPTIHLENIVATLRQLNPLLLDHILLFIFYYKLEHTFVLDKILFAHVLATAPHLSLGELFGMVYEHLS